MRQRAALLMTGLLLPGWCMGCAATGGPPAWIHKEAILQGAGQARFFFGVGKVGGIKDRDQAAKLAEEQARTALYPLLRRFALKLVQCFQNDRAGRGMPIDQRLAELLVKRLERAGLKVTTVIEYWYQRQPRITLALARLQLKDLSEALLWDDMLPKKFRDFYKLNAVHLHKEMTRLFTRSSSIGDTPRGRRAASHPDTGPP